MYDKSPVAVIGSNSFSGASFVDYLLEHGHDVVGFSRSIEPDHVFLPYKLNQHRTANRGMFRFVQADMNQDLLLIVDTIKQSRIDYIVNFAAQGMVAESWQKPLHWFMTNTLAHIALHDELRKLDFIKKYVHVSTPEVYGTCVGTIKENSCYNPSTPYAVSKAACDLSLMTFFKNYKFPVCWTRAANVYGPCQLLYRIMPKTILSIQLGKKLPLHGGGHSVRSFIHIRDVADATMRILFDAPPGQIYHLSTDRFISICDLVALICGKMGADFDKVVDIVGERAGKDQAYLLDSGKARSTLGWQDNMSLEQGIDETIHWVRDNIDTLKNQTDCYIHKQ